MNVYDSIVDSIQELDPATRGEIYTAVIEYLRFEREPDLDGMSQIARVLFMSFKPNLDNQIAKSKAGKRSGESRREQAANERRTNGEQNANTALNKTRTEREQNANEQEQEQETEKPSADAEGQKRATRFVRPTPEEVDAYIAEKGYSGFTGQQFCDHYEANGWMRGKNRIRDWKACVRTWQVRRLARDGPKRKPAAYYSAFELPIEEVLA